MQEKKLHIRRSGKESYQRALDVKIPEELETFNDRVRRICREQSHSAKWLRDEIGGMPYRQFHDWLLRKNPNPGFVKRIAFALGVDIEYLRETFIPRGKSGSKTREGVTILKILDYNDATLDKFVGSGILSEPMRKYVRTTLRHLYDEAERRQAWVIPIQYYQAEQEAKRQLMLELNLNQTQLATLLKNTERWRTELDVRARKLIGIKFQGRDPFGRGRKKSEPQEEPRTAPESV